MNNKIIKIICILITILFLTSSIISANPIYSMNKNVDQQTISNKFGNTLYVGGSGPNNYTKIQDAINDAFNGDTVFVFDDSSPYFENIIIDKIINLIGEDKKTTIIDGMELENVVEISANYVKISKFTIQNKAPVAEAGILGYTNYSILSDNKIISNNWSGLVLVNSHFNEITGNIISSNRWIGIYLGTCNCNIISGNTIISNNKEGIFQYNSSNNKITGNIISKNEIGIYTSLFCSNNIISNNIAIFNEYAIRFYESGYNNTIRHNSIRWNRCGLSMEYSYNNRIENNNFVRNIFNAHFDGYYLDKNRTNYWNGNYWNRPRILPKIIFGTLWTYGPFQWEFDLGIDRNPAQEPYYIGV
jgi:parallel beta-helix repeat protein